MVKRNCTFKDDWLIEFEWVEIDPNAGTVYCQLCHFTFDISNMERSAVTNHSKGKKHKNKEISRKSLFNIIFCKKKSSVVSLTVSDLDQEQYPSVPSLSSDVQHKRQRTLSLLKSCVTEAETLWAIKTVLTHSSLRSCDCLSKLFTLGRTKCILSLLVLACTWRNCWLLISRLLIFLWLAMMNSLTIH